MIRAALVGVSGYGRWHLLMAMEQALVGRLRLVGATIINPTEEPVITQRLRRQGVPVFGRFDEMMTALAGRVDLVLVPTAIQWHARMTIAALNAGAHVLVEKPIAATLQEVDAIIAARERTGRTVAVGFQDLYVPATHDIKRRILAGQIGRLQRVVVTGQWPRPMSYYARNSWAGRLRADGGWVLDSPVSNAHAHFLMLALFWAGTTPATAAEIESVQAELYRVNEIESFDTVSFRALTRAGIEILFYASHAGQEDFPPEIRLVGDDGQIRWTYERSYTIAAGAAPLESCEVPEQLDTRLTVLEAMMGRLAGNQNFIVEAELARGHTRLMNALHEFFPIHALDPECVAISDEPAGTFRRVRGLDALMAAAAARGELFSEAGAPWGETAELKSLAGYEAFGGCWRDPMAEPAVVR
jgi:predicted dehydrogenase